MPNDNIIISSSSVTEELSKVITTVANRHLSNGKMVNILCIDLNLNTGTVGMCSAGSEPKGFTPKESRVLLIYMLKVAMEKVKCIPEQRSVTSLEEVEVEGG